jgi:hypothetical protein
MATVPFDFLVVKLLSCTTLKCYQLGLESMYILYLTLSYSSKINGYLYQQKVLRPEKKRPDLLSEGSAALQVRCDSPLQIVMAVWRPFCLNLNFLGRL